MMKQLPIRIEAHDYHEFADIERRIFRHPKSFDPYYCGGFEE